MTRVRNNAFRENRETVIDDEELALALAKAVNPKESISTFANRTIAYLLCFFFSALTLNLQP